MDHMDEPTIPEVIKTMACQVLDFFIAAVAFCAVAVILFMAVGGVASLVTGHGIISWVAWVGRGALGLMFLFGVFAWYAIAAEKARSRNAWQRGHCTNNKYTSHSKFPTKQHRDK